MAKENGGSPIGAIPSDLITLGAILVALFVGMIAYVVCFVMGMKGKFDLERNEEGQIENKLKCGCC